MQTQSSALTFFLYLLVFFSLIIVNLGAGRIYFELIDMNLKEGYDILANGYDLYSVRNAVASLIVGMPALLILSTIIQKLINNGKIYADNTARNWMIYIILGISGIIFLWMLVAVINQFLSGDPDKISLAQFITVLILASVTLGYFLYDLRQPLSNGYLLKRITNYVITALLATTIAIGLYLIPTPKAAAEMKADQEKRDKIGKIHYAVDDYYYSERELPDNLKILIDRQLLSKEDSVDVETKAQFIYKVTSKKSYEICTNLKQRHISYSAQWSHKAGEHCFKFFVRD